MRILIFATLLLLSTGGFAQIVNTGWQGHEYETKQFSDIDGSPFLFDEWYRGKIIGPTGLILDGITIKYEAYSETIIYQSSGKVYEVAGGAAAFVIYPATDGMKDSLYFRGGYPAVDYNTANSFYEVLVDGKVSLLKSHRKGTGLSQQNALASNKREFILQEDLYLARAGQTPVKWKKDKDALLDFLGDKKDAVSAWLGKNKVNLKKEEGLTDVLKFYNSL
jgi:hypothetical protein